MGLMPSDADAALGVRISQLLRERGLTQDKLGEALRIEQGGISRRLNGRVPIRAAELIAIAGFLDVTVAELTERVA